MIREVFHRPYMGHPKEPRTSLCAGHQETGGCDDTPTRLRGLVTQSTVKSAGQIANERRQAEERVKQRRDAFLLRKRMRAAKRKEEFERRFETGTQRALERAARRKAAERLADAARAREVARRRNHRREALTREEILRRRQKYVAYCTRRRRRGKHLKDVLVRATNTSALQA